MGFIEDWNKTIEADPYWQFEDLFEEDTGLAEAVWHEMRVLAFLDDRFNATVKE